MKHTGTLALIICIGLIAYLLADRAKDTKAKKIGMVQMQKLVYDFKGMKEATSIYTAKLERWGRESDSLENRLKLLYKQLKLDSLSKDQVALNRHIQAFAAFKQSYNAYTQNIEETAAKEDKQMTLGVINQVNEYMKQYAEQEGYDVILCNSEQQSVGYAKEQIDVTGEVLAYANKQYEGK